MFRGTRITCAVAATLLFSTFFPRTSTAQPRPAGSIGLFFDAAGTRTYEMLDYSRPVVTFSLYVVAFDPPADLGAYQFSIEVQANPGSTVIFGNSELPGDFEQVCDSAPSCIIALSPSAQCVPKADVVVLGRWDVMALAPLATMEFRVAASPFSSVSPPMADFAVCRTTNDVRPFALAYDGWALITDTVPTAASAWGAVKALYGDR